ncbi:MAG: PAS domain-containing protein, partial [Defluviitaleaceae bacterium]|nr:PAS domain-containing protein [Defluviitaleaceae bacterium]
MRIHITKLIKILIVVFGILAAINIMFILLAAQAKDMVVEAYDTRHTLASAIFRFESGSRTLTRYARVHAARAYSALDYSEPYILYRASHDNRIGEALVIFTDKNAPQNEIDRLHHAMYLSDILRSMEAQSFQAHVSGYTHQSVELVFGTEYIAYSNQLSSHLDELTEIMALRMQEQVNSTESLAQLYETFAMVAAVLLALASVMGTVLLLQEVKAAMQREREASKLSDTIMQAAPFSIELWDENARLTFCNQQTADIMGLPSSDEYIKRVDEFIPKYQPCGTSSIDKWDFMFNHAMRLGYVKDEWHSLDEKGILIPMECTLVRIINQGKYAVVGFNTDLREIKAATQRELAAAELNRALLDSMPMFLEFWDENMQFYDCSRQAIEMLGISAKQEYIDNYFKYQPTHQSCGTLSFEKNANIIVKAMKEGSARSEWLHLKSNGELFHVETIFVRIHLHGRDIIVGFSYNMTDIKAAIEKERKANEFNQILINASPIVINQWNEELSLVSTSAQAIKMFGLSSQKQYIQRFYELSPEYQPCGTPSREKAVSFLKEAFNEGRSQFEWLHQTLDKELIPTEVTLVRSTRNDKTIILAYTTDLRMVKIATDKMKQAEDRANLLIEALPLSCFLLDSNFAAVGCNQAILRMFVVRQGRTFPDFCSEQGIFERCSNNCNSCARQKRDTCLLRRYFLNNFMRIFPKYEDDPISVKEVISSTCRTASNYGVQVLEYVLMAFSGDKIPCEVTIVPVHYQSETGFAIYLRDQREEKRREIAEEESRAKT